MTRIDDVVITIGQVGRGGTRPGTTVPGMTAHPATSPVRRRRAGLLLAASALLLAALTGCSAAGGSSADEAAGGGADRDGSLSGPAGPAQDAAPPAPEQAAGSAGQVGDSRMVITNGELYLTAEDPVGAADRVADLVAGLGGRIDERDQQAGAEGHAGSATMTVRVPAGSLDEAVDRIGDLGEVSRYTESAKDVTDTVVDLDARIGAAEVSVARVQEFLERAADTTDLLATERELSTRQAELESLRAQRATLGAQVAMSTLYLSITAPGDGVIERPGPDTFTEGVGVGWRSLWQTVRGVAVVLGVLLPWLVLAAVVTTVVVVLARRRRRNVPPNPPQQVGSGPTPD